MAEKVREFKGRRGRLAGPPPKVENAGKLLSRVLGFLFKHYGVQAVIVVICIFIGVFASVQGTLFTKTLIDSYITPMLSAVKAGGEADYGPLSAAIAKVAVFYLIGASSNYLQSRLMVYISQGTLRDMRNGLFKKMQTLPISYFDTHSHGDIMSVYTNDIDTLRQMISQSLPQIINSVVTIISVFASMLTLSLPLTAVTIVMIAIMIFASKNLCRKIGKILYKTAERSR
jgi:ATP-binding cassette subfamily B multidrug efflux pump